MLSLLFGVMVFLAVYAGMPVSAHAAEASISECDSMIINAVKKHESRENLSEALKILQKAGRTAETNGWHKQEFLALNNIGAVYLQNYSYGEALDYFNKAYFVASEHLKSGETWTPIYRNWESEFIYPAKVAFCPDNQSKLYIFRGNGPSGVNGGILISEDEGKTWHETLPGHSLQTYAFNPLNPEEIYVGTASYAAHEAVFHSTDGGETWEIVDFPWTPFILNNVIDITYDRLDPNNVIVVEEDQIFMTSDGFRTFANIAPEGYMWGTIVSINPFDSDDVVIGVDMNGIMRSDDRMQTHRMISSFKVDSYCGDVATSGEDVFYLRSGLCRMLGSGASVEEKYASVYADVAGSHSVFAYDADADRLDRIVFSENPVRSTVCSGMGKPSGIVAAGSDGRYIAGMGGKLYTVEIGADDVSCTDTA